MEVAATSAATVNGLNLYATGSTNIYFTSECSE